LPLESIICRKKLDELYGNEWRCECFVCKRIRTEMIQGEESPGEFEAIGEKGGGYPELEDHLGM
jgi:hypothetical protein